MDRIAAVLQSQIDDLKALLAGITPPGNKITFSGVNVRIDNGAGATDGKVKGLGNLIVGYNELRHSSEYRSGSHNIVVGRGNNYTSFGGLVIGINNTVSGIYSSVSGGRGIMVAREFSSASASEVDKWLKKMSNDRNR